MKWFSIYTFVSDWEEYNAMVASFREAGFNDDSTTFAPLDNSTGNSFDPYEEIPRQCRKSRSKFVIFCHQDVRTGPADRMDTLRDILLELGVKRRNWAVAGNAGVTRSGKYVLHLGEPRDEYRMSETPIEVLSLDENFLIFNPAAKISTTAGLSGFHFYGSDVCLNSHFNGTRSFVIPFWVRHLSSGNMTTTSYMSAKNHFAEKWSSKIAFGLYRSMCAEIRFGTYPWLEKLLRNRWCEWILYTAGFPLVRSGRSLVSDFLRLCLRFWLGLPSALFKKRLTQA